MGKSNGTAWLPAVLALGGAPVWADPLPFQRGQEDAVVVPVTLDGRGPFPFLLDTGATLTRLEPGLAAELALPPGRLTEVVTMAGRGTLSRSRVGRLGLGPHVLQDVDVVTGAGLRLPDVGRTIRGVLGQSALGRIRYGIDYRRRRIVFDRPTGGRAVCVRLEWHEGRPAAVVQDGDAGRLALVLDAGLDEAVFFERPGRPLPFPAIPGVRYRSASTAGSADLRAVSVPSLAVGSIRLERLRAAVVPDALAGVRREDGLLPTRLFASVFFDRDAGEVVFEPR